MDGFIPRSLSYLDKEGRPRTSGSDDLLEAAEPIIILGEPGAGKTWLLERIALEPTRVLLSAGAFIHHPNPSALLTGYTTVVIDGLDELAAVDGSDPINRVIAQLISAGNPKFVLSCRAADWRGAVAKEEIRRAYGLEPIEATLVGFSEEDACSFLQQQMPRQRALEVIGFLREKSMEELFANPLTLRLLSDIAGRAERLPESRAELLSQASRIMWAETSDRHLRSSLAMLDEESALGAAGAVFAALILTGSEGIALGTLQSSDRILRFAEVATLPLGQHVQAVLNSRLFISNVHQPGLLRPFHRTIAEYLAARWLATVLKSEASRERFLALITIDRGVPASLRGLHAWLPHFSSAFAKPVMLADPYGVLRYGDADGLGTEEARILLRSLVSLQEDDPFFRAEDWSPHTARAFSSRALFDEISGLIVSPETGAHLRALLIQSIGATSMAARLRDVLIEIVAARVDGPPYLVRSAAAEALSSLDLKEPSWPQLIADMLTDEDAGTRLALEMLGGRKCAGVSDELIATAVLSYLGMLPDAEDPEAEDRRVGGVLYSFSRKIPPHRYAGILDAIAILRPCDLESDYHSSFELSSFVTRLVANAIESGETDPNRIISWLRIRGSKSGYSSNEVKRLSQAFVERPDLRRAIQHEVLFLQPLGRSLYSNIWWLSRANPSLSIGIDDAIHFLLSLTQLKNVDPNRMDAAWEVLSRFARHDDARMSEVIAAAEQYARNRPALQTSIANLKRPPEPEQWEIEEKARQLSWDAERAEAWMQTRKKFYEHSEELEGGDPRWSIPVAQCYLGRFNDIDNTAAPQDRIEQWLGRELQSKALVGLRATLERVDLPGPDEIALSYAQSRRWNFIFPIIAGLEEHRRLGFDLSDVDEDIILSGRLGIENELLGENDSFEALRIAIDTKLRSDANLEERYFRLLIEPGLVQESDHIPGLYAFVRDSDSRALSIRLAREWLERFPDLPKQTESELIGVLLAAGCTEACTEIAIARLRDSNALEDLRKKNWQAILFVSDYEQFLRQVKQPVSKDFIWDIRHWMGREWHEKLAEYPMKPRQLEWVVSSFRALWKDVPHPAGVWGDGHPSGASDFIRDAIASLAADITDDAARAFDRLLEEPADDYLQSIKYGAEQQRKARREANFAGVTLAQLRAAVLEQAPQSTADLRAVVVRGLKQLQAELRGSDTDVINKYYRDDGAPRNEDWCTDRIIEDVQRHLSAFGVIPIPQKDMPEGKRADIVFALGQMGLPVECKGQWNTTLWTAAKDQLDRFYVSDWRADGSGLFLVYWFGKVSQPGKRLKRPPRDIQPPQSAAELQDALVAMLPRDRRGRISVFVLDLSR